MPPAPTSARRLDTTAAVQIVERLVLPVVFGAITVGTLWLSIGGWFGLDARVYRAAAAAVLAGHDPWRVTVDGLPFAGPPPTLLMYLPAAFVPESVAVVAYTVLNIVAAVVLVRSLRLPSWWLLFPPISGSIIVGNPDVVVACLAVCGGRFAGLAIPIKLYAAIPLLFERRFGAIALGAAVCALTLPLVPMFMADAGVINGTFDAFADGRLSAWGSPLFVPTLIAILLMRARGGGWLAVPALWPHTQLHYACLALPALRGRPVVAIALSIGFVQLAPAAILAQAAWELWRLRRTRTTEAQRGLRPVEASA
jgi:hypothetical protein